jgi:hypothetical protein
MPWPVVTGSGTSPASEVLQPPLVLRAVAVPAALIAFGAGDAVTADEATRGASHC